MSAVVVVILFCGSSSICGSVGDKFDSAWQASAAIQANESTFQNHEVCNQYQQNII